MGNLIGRLSISSLLDKYPFRIVMSFVYSLQIFLISVVSYSVSDKAFYLVVVFLSFACDGVMGSVVPTVAIEVFGHKRGHEVYSFLFANFGLASICSALIISVLLKYMGYKYLFILCLVSTVISFTLAMSLDTKKPFDYIALKRKKEKISIQF